MGIPSITEVRSQPSAMAPAAPAAPTLGASPAVEEAATTAVAPVPEPPPAAAPPPPPPKEPFPFDITVGEHEPTGHKVYDFVDEDTGRSVVQIPVQAVLNLVADVLRQLEAEGRR